MILILFNIYLMSRNRHKNKEKKTYSDNSIGARLNGELIKKKFHEKLKSSNSNGKENPKKVL